MASVRLEIRDPANRLTLRTILKAAGHSETDGEPEVMITDNADLAVTWADRIPTLVLAHQNDVGDAVRAMQRGAYGYILLPFQAGEAEIMVRRAAGSRGAATGPSLALAQRPESLAEVEARHIRQVLRYCRNNRAKAARMLGIGRNTLWRKLKGLEEAGHSE
jgi:DNA-binding NtrC family response regulator